MKIIVVTFSVVFSFCIISCNKKNNQSTLDYYRNTDYIPKENVLYKKITLKPQRLDTSIESTFAGYFTIYENRLFFADLYFSYVFEFDSSFKVVNQYAGKGKGPNEVTDFLYFIPGENDFCLLSSGNSLLYTFDYYGEKMNTVRIKWKGTIEIAKNLYNDPDPKDYRCYEPDFGIDGIVKNWDNEHIVYGITASWPKFNGYFNSEKYYMYSRILAVTSKKTGEITRILGRRSPIFLKYQNIPNFDHFAYEVTKKNIFLTFWPDEKIYVIDKRSDKVVSVFGKKGKNMNTLYRTTHSYETAEMQLQKDWEEYGYYHYLKIVGKKNLLFRGYKKGNLSKTDGLQIYKLDTGELIADLNVPKDFVFLGEFFNRYYGWIDKSNINEKDFFIYEIKLY